MIPHGRHAVLFSAILSMSTFLAAQDRDVVLAKINNTKTFLLKQRVTAAYRESIRKSALAYESTLETHCKDVDLDFDSTGVKDRILALLELDDKGLPVAGAWKESIPGTACSEKRTYNVQVNVTPKGQRFTTTFPGDAAGNPELQNDTLKNIEANFSVLRIPSKKSCHLAVVDTHLIGAPSTVQDNGIMTQWKESWDVQKCGKVYTVPVTYIPDDKGTRISVATSDIQPR